MKATSETISAIAEKFRLARKWHAEKFGPFPPLRDAELYKIWHWIYSESTHPDDSPRFTVRGFGRCLPFDPTWQLYPDGMNDDTLRTALRAACRKAGIALA